MDVTIKFDDTQPFFSLNVGDVFQNYEGEICLKIASVMDQHGNVFANAVDLRTGNTTAMVEGAVIWKVNAEMVLHCKKA